MGWGLSGISRVHRCVRTPSRDVEPGGVTWDDGEDNFCLDGQKLVQVALDALPEHMVSPTTPGLMAAAEYRLENDIHHRIIRFDSQGAQGAATAWARIEGPPSLL
ncbi:MAG: hypothetical protein R3B72_47510 [Polyangiaceae bacterium]